MEILRTTIEPGLYLFSSIALLGIFGRKLTRRDLEEAEKYGGSDYLDWHEYEQPNGQPSFDKGGHRERSIANDPKHLEHWKKVGK